MLISLFFGYANVTFLNSMTPLNVSGFIGFYGFLTKGDLSRT
jgi:hypothetical protein